jgi:ZIP family zinc transporter
MSPGEGFTKAMPAAIGFAMGALFLFSLDKILPHLHINFPEERAEGVKTKWHSTMLLVLAITLHNIPEGLAVGVLFGGVAAGIPEASISGAVALAIGIGLQNFPSGTIGFQAKIPGRKYDGFIYACIFGLDFLCFD